MCLNTTQLEPLIAKEDIKCYKFLEKKDNRLISPYYYFIWTKGKVEKTEIGKWDGTYQVIKSGFHAFMSKRDLRKHLRFMIDINAFGKKHQKFRKRTFIIPKGSEYYINEYKTEIVSNQIKMK